MTKRLFVIFLICMAVWLAGSIGDLVKSESIGDTLWAVASIAVAFYLAWAVSVARKADSIKREF